MSTRSHVSIVWVTIGAALALWAGAAQITTRVSDGNEQDQRRQAEKTKSFYRAVAAGTPVGGQGPLGKLAADLQELEATRIVDFRGDSNRYGGITDQLGFDPFDGPNCSECGRLDHDVQMALFDIKEGKLDRVLAEIDEGVEESDGAPKPSAPVWFLWLVSLPGYLGYTFIRGKRQEEDRYREFGTERTLLRQVQEIRRSLPASDPRASGLDQLARRLEAQMSKRVTFAGQKKQDMRLEALTAELEAAVESIEAGNRELT